MIRVDAAPESQLDETDVQQMFEGQSITDPMCRRRPTPVSETPSFGGQSSSQVFGGFRQHVPGTPMGP